MMLLPKSYQFVKIPCGHRQDVTHIRLTPATRPDRVTSIGERDIAIGAKINDYLNLGVEAMHVPRRVVHRVGSEADAVNAERTHLFGL
jgi:hypothetical protein